jgi:hypothetical protein
MSPADYRAFKEFERRRIAVLLHEELARARREQPEWYVWVCEHRRQRLAALGREADF